MREINTFSKDLFCVHMHFSGQRIGVCSKWQLQERCEEGEALAKTEAEEDLQKTPRTYCKDNTIIDGIYL